MDLLAVIAAGIDMVSKIVDFKILRWQSMTPEQRVVETQNELDLMKPGMELLRLLAGLLPQAPKP